MAALSDPVLLLQYASIDMSSRNVYCDFTKRYSTCLASVERRVLLKVEFGPH